MAVCVFNSASRLVFLAVLVSHCPMHRVEWASPANPLFLPGPSRCYAFWQEVLGCYVVNAGDGETGKKKCLPALDDYYECLHHKKEVRRVEI